MSEGKVIFRQNIYSQGAEIAGFASNLVFNVVFPILLGSLVFGAASIVLGFAYLLGSFISSGTSNLAMVLSSKYFQKDPLKFRHNFAYLTRISLALSFLFSALLFVFSGEIAAIYGMPGIHHLLRAASLIVLFRSAMTHFNTALIGMRRTQDILIISLINSIALVLIPFALFMAIGIEGFILGVAASYLIAFMLSISFFGRRQRLCLSFDAKAVRKKFISNEIILFTVLSFKHVFLRWVLLLILGLFVVSSEVAFFKVSMSWVSVVATLIPISGAVMFASFVHLKAAEPKKMKQYLAKITRYSLILMVPAIAGLSLMADKLVLLVYGPEYIGAALPMAIMSLFIVFSFFDNIFYYIIASYDKLLGLAKGYAAAMALSAVAAALLMGQMGLTGAAIVYVFSSFLLFSASIGIVMRHVSSNALGMIVKGMAKPMLASAAMAASILWSSAFLHGIIGVLSTIALAILVYFAAMLAIGGIRYSDMSLLRRLMR